jgi:hypothetical protein
LEIKGQKYANRPLNLIKDLSPESLNLSTLTGLVDYIKANVDKFPGTFLLQVVDHRSVKLLSPLKGDSSRDCYIQAQAKAPDITFDSFIPVEKFNIMLQSCFLSNDDRDLVLKVAGNIKEENVRNTGDDGISQTVTAKTGIAKVEEIKVPNPVVLVPFRTFVEIEQPEIKFVFRMQDGPRAALFEADGGAWKLKTMLDIKDYLKSQLEQCDVEIIA